MPQNWQVSNYYRIAAEIGGYNSCAIRYPVTTSQIDLLGYEVWFSDGSAPPLYEWALDETASPFDRNVSMDYNCDGVLETGVSFDINFDGGLAGLTDYDDIANMGTVFYRSGVLNTNDRQLFTYEVTSFFSSAPPGKEYLTDGGTGFSPNGRILRQAIFSDKQPVVNWVDESLLFRSRLGLCDTRYGVSDGNATEFYHSNNDKTNSREFHYNRSNHQCKDDERCSLYKKSLRFIAGSLDILAYKLSLGWEQWVSFIKKAVMKNQ